MPPKVIFTKQTILEASIQLIRSKGGSAFTIRNIAAQMGGSTQPIYRLYQNQEELEKELLLEISRNMVKRMAEREKDHSDFLAIGLAYIQFAIDEPELLKFLYFSGRNKSSIELDDYNKRVLLQKMGQDPFMKNFEHEKLSFLLESMFLYTQGIIVDILFNKEPKSFEVYREKLHDVGENLIIAEYVKKFSGPVMNKIKEKL